MGDSRNPFLFNTSHHSPCYIIELVLLQPTFFFFLKRWCTKLFASIFPENINAPFLFYRFSTNVYLKDFYIWNTRILCKIPACTQTPLISSAKLHYSDAQISCVSCMHYIIQKKDNGRRFLDGLMLSFLLKEFFFVCMFFFCWVYDPG